MTHVHNPWLCPTHVGGCGCPDAEATLCNPYYLEGHCPERLLVMPGETTGENIQGESSELGSGEADRRGS